MNCAKCRQEIGEIKNEITGDLCTETPTLAQDIKEMMAGWDKIMATAEEQFPKAAKEELYQIAKGAMNHALGIWKVLGNKQTFANREEQKMTSGQEHIKTKLTGFKHKADELAAERCGLTLSTYRTMIGNMCQQALVSINQEKDGKTMCFK